MKKKVIKMTSLILILIFLIILYIIFCNTKKISPNGNISNSGLVVQDSNKNVYYYKYGVGIFKLENDTEKEIATEKNAYSLYLEKESLYYLSTEDMNNIAIKKIDLKTNEGKKICDISTFVNKIFVKNSDIYYVTYKGDGGIIKIDANSLEEKSILCSNVLDFHIDFSAKKIYFINESNQICSANLDGKDIKILNENIRTNKIQVIQEWIYYYEKNENALFRISTNGKKQTLISTVVHNDTYNVFEKNIYYLDEENMAIMKMKIGKSNIIDKIVDLQVSKTKINVANDELYYLNKSQDGEQIYQIFKVKLN